MKELSLHYQKHVLVCTNERSEGSCCSKVGGYELFHTLKEYLKAHGLAGHIWVTRTGCLGFCNDVGATVVVYPERKWFTEVIKEELPQIIEEVMKQEKE